MKPSLVVAFFILNISFWNSLLTHALNNDEEAIVELNEEFDVLGLLNTLLNVPDDWTLDEILIIGTQNVILDVLDSPIKPDNFDELVANWIKILGVLNVNGTSAVLIGELKPYISKILVLCNFNFFD